MQYQFFTNSEKTWASMYDAITNAQQSVYLEMYIFEDTVEKYHFFDLLKKKASNGIRVRIILDAFGSMELSNKKIAELWASGAEVLFRSYLLHRAHRKIVIVDEKIWYIGGVNFHKNAQFWNDLVVKVDGVLIRNIVKSFIKSYINAGGVDPVILAQKNTIVSEKLNAWIVEHSPFQNLFSLKKIYLEHINAARNHIFLVTPYFTPRRWLSAALHQAILRGVTVEILIPRHTDYFMVNRVNYYYMYQLTQLWVIFHLEPQMNHAKVMVIDADIGLVGSQNLDFFSFDFNSEVGVFFHDVLAVEELTKIIEQWKSESTLFESVLYKPRWFDSLLSFCIRLFSKIF